MAVHKIKEAGRVTAIALRLEGKTYREIGTALGVTRQRAQQILSPLAAVKDAVVTRAGGRCEGCQVPTGRSGHIHHHQVKGLTPEAYNAEPNLALLCVACHRTAHRNLDAWARRHRRLTPEERRIVFAQNRAKIGAAHLGIPVEEYRRHLGAGERWCGYDHRWEPIEGFGKDKRTPDGVSRRCKASNLRQTNESKRRAMQRDPDLFLARQRAALRKYSLKRKQPPTHDQLGAAS